MSVIDPRDKHRFGEDATSLIYSHASATAKKLGVELVVESDYLRINGFEARRRDGVIEVDGITAEIDDEQWEAFITLALNHFVNTQQPPRGEALRQILFAIGATPRE
ncbi:hypothetical protein [Pyrobaculum aerophilum]|uniref:Uncharacterized protein n=1 Tax=Pyrobaculum aerophilum TaxID=13773 RepID=A0A371QYR7_9CREN|nr:hypothetical protein [Pyrobaculum aerophilum]RFA95960.1 hypothetical protein CGL51_06525 [Pyrobaculum aerophilum]RFA99110.1 hypothetical protein CGL52_05175 [Pyrobaculum aerophilum]